ncbi:HAD family hydrolase [Flavobacterium sp.]|jgi:HAD superfamily hydrolase (TIGR01509 family)|uniref:HAD family hydrolase n=1 Tax=Flavobacterium sp. TaxID=239 RepID=UPI0037C12057
MKYKCIIFDCDGVLVDSEAISSSVLTEMANELGIKISHEEALENFTGKSLKYSLDYIEAKYSKSLPDNFEDEFRKKSFHKFSIYLKPINGVHDVLNNLTIPFCVASSGPVEKIINNLTTTKLIHHFEGKIFSSYEIKSWKPEPDIFLYAAKNMGFEINDCLIIEDSITGIQAAKCGGFDVIGFVNDNNKERFKNENIPICYSMSELENLLKYQIKQ